MKPYNLEERTFEFARDLSVFGFEASEKHSKY